MLLRHLRKKDTSDFVTLVIGLIIKKLQNEVPLELKAKRKSYFSQKLEESQGNTEETWKVLNTAMGHRSKSTVINRLAITDHEAIAQELNHHF